MSILKTNFKQSLSFESFLSKNFIQVSKNGNKIFCPFYDNINILSFDNGIKHDSIGKDGMDDIVSCFTIKNEENIIVAYKNGLIRLWDVCKNECLRSWKTFTLTPICAMSMDDLTQSFLAFGTTTNGLIKIYDVENGYYTHQFKQIGAGGVSNITFQYDSELKEIVCVIAACENHSIYVWPLNSEDTKSKSTKNSFRFCLTSHTAQITGLVVLHECQKLISCAQDRLIILWDLTVGRPLKLFQTKASLCAGISQIPNQFSNVSSLDNKIDTNDFNSDNDLQHKYSFITIDANSDLVCWCLQLFSSSDNTKSINDDTLGDNIAIKDPYKLSRIYETNLLDQYMAATSCDSDNRNVDMNDQIDNMKMEQDSTNANINREKVADALQPVYSCYNPATQKFFIVNHQKDIACFDVRNKRWAQRFVGEIEEICALKLMKYPECLDGTNTSFDGIQALMAIADNTPQIKIFEMTSFECKLTLYGHSENVLVLATVPNHSDILVSASKDNSIIVWKIEVCPNNTDSFQYQILETLYGHTNAVTALSCFKSQGESFFTITSCSSDHTLKRWDITLNSILSITSNSNKNIKKKDNKNLKNENLTLNNNNNNMENLVSHKKTNFYVCSFTIVAHEKAINCVAIEPRKAKYIATGSMDKTIKIWDFLNGTLISTLNGHKRGVWDLTFSHQILVSGSGDFTIKLWSLTDFSCLKTLEGHSAPVLKLDFLSNAMAKDSMSKQIISCSSDGIFKLWTLGNEDCVTLKNGHDGKVWAFDLDPTGSNAYFVSAGAVDGKIIVWKDATSEELQEIKSKKDSQIYGNQELSNLIKQKVFNERVVQLTTELEDRDSLIKSIQTALETHQFNFTSLQTIIKNLDSAHLDTLLRFIVHWNTNSRTCHVAQLFLNAILRSIHPQSLARLPNITSTIQAILPYSDRHFDRLSKLYQDSSYLEYLANCACIQPVLLS